MVQPVKSRVIIPPYWPKIAFGIFVLILEILLEKWAADPGEPIVLMGTWQSRFLILASVYIIIEGCFHWSIHEKFIMVHFLWIPVRIIRWEKVFNAEYIYSWSTGAKWGTMEGQGIFITLEGCPLFSPEVDALNFFMMQHPFRTIFIRFTPRKQKRYVELFKRYYPTLDFQLGYEKNLEKGN